MSAIVTLSATTVVATAATVIAATLPEARDVLSPVLEGGNEYAVAAGSLLLTLPLIGVLTVLTVLGRE
jgi:hypothetical protein